MTTSPFVLIPAPAFVGRGLKGTDRLPHALLDAGLADRLLAAVIDGPGPSMPPMLRRSASGTARTRARRALRCARRRSCVYRSPISATEASVMQSMPHSTASHRRSGVSGFISTLMYLTTPSCPPSTIASPTASQSARSRRYFVAHARQASLRG